MGKTGGEHDFEEEDNAQCYYAAEEGVRVPLRIGAERFAG